MSPEPESLTELRDEARYVLNYSKRACDQDVQEAIEDLYVLAVAELNGAERDPDALESAGAMVMEMKEMAGLEDHSECDLQPDEDEG